MPAVALHGRSVWGAERPLSVSPTPEEEQVGFRPLPEWTQPLVWAPQGKRPVYRFFAHLLIRLLVLSPMPVECQAWAFFFPTSLLWSLTPPSTSPSVPAGPQGSGTPDLADPATSPLSESPGEASCGAADPTGLVRMISLTDPTQPRITGTIPYIGGRLAFGENGALLFGSAKSAWGGDTELGGVRTAALGKITLVDTDPRVIVVGEGPRAAEPFKLKFRVIPEGTEVTGAKIEYRIDQATHSSVPVTLTQGRGQLDVPFGFTFPRVGNVLSRVRLVAKDEEGQDILSPARAWTLEQPEVELVWGDKDVEPDSGIEPKDETVTADYPRIGAELVSAEWFRRYDEMEAPETAAAVKVDWQALSDPATMRGPATLAKDGIHENELLTGTQALAERSARAYIEDVLLGETDPVVVEAGLASESTSGLSAERVAVPADGATEVLLTLEAKDQYGNPVSDGSVVVWEKGEDTDGELVEAQEVTQGGQATVKYRAGVDNGVKTVRAHVDDAVLETEITQAPIGLLLIAPTQKYSSDHSEVILTLQATSVAGPVSDNAQIGWLTSIGRMEQTQALTNGEAKARWHFGGVSIRPRVRFTATLGQGMARRELLWERVGFASISTFQEGTRTADGAVDGTYAGVPLAQDVPPVPYRETSVEPLMIAGDLTEDGYVPIERADGTFEDIFVKASATYRATGLLAGERVTLRLGTNVAPNLVPIAHYTGEALLTEDASGEVPDVTGAHDGQASGVTTAEPGYRGQAFDLDGTGGISVPHDEEFEFSGAFMVQTAVRPPAASAPGEPTEGSLVLLEKEGEYRLDLVETDGDLYARFTVQTAEGEESITSLTPLDREQWSLLSGRYESGRIWIGVDADGTHANDSAFLATAPVHGIAGLQIGPGFVGGLDEIRVFDLTKEPLSTFPGGLTALSFVADETGSYETVIVSTGQLGLARVVHYYRNLAQESLRMAQDEPPPTTLQAGLGSSLIEVETFWEDTAERSTTWYGYCGAVLMGSMVKVARGVMVGSEPGEMDLAVMAGDMLGSTLLGPVGILRDLANSTERLIYAQPSGDDALGVALGLTTIASAVFKGKVGVLLQLPKLAKVLKPGSRAAGTLARVTALEAKLAAGASGVSKVRKLVEVAQLSSGASQMVGAVLDAAGVHVEALEAFNTMMSNVPEEEQLGVLEELKAAAEEMEADDLRMTMQALGTGYGGGPAAHQVLRKWFLQVTAETVEGARTVRTAVRASGLRSAGTRTARIVRNGLADLSSGATKTQPEEILSDLAKIEKKLGSESHVAIGRVAKRLGSNNDKVRQGERFVLSFIVSKLGSVANAGELAVEKLSVVTLRNGKRVKRYYDAIIGGVYHECKSWNPAKWPAVFPPAKGFRPWDSAKRQWLRDIRLHTSDAPQKLRWVFPEEYLARYPELTIADEFAKLLEGRRFRKMFDLTNPEDVAAYRGALSAFGAAFGPSGTRTSKLDRRLIARLLVSHRTP